MKIISIHAHFDDFEFTAAGLFELWRRKLPGELEAKVVVCTDGKAGHQFRTREETGAMRLAEQERSARAGKYQFELLRLPDGKAPREACLQVTPDLLAALWKTIREFEPDYLFCPPVTSDPLAGIHVDHIAVAEAVRRAAYMINVPHAFTPEFPADETRSVPKKTPVIVNVYDGYMFGENSFDLAIDVEPVFETIRDTSWQHQSQISEWLPWVGRHRMKAPGSVEEWEETLRRRFERKNAELGIKSGRPTEVFTITAWGEIPEFARALEDFPGVDRAASNLAALEARLKRWRGEP